MFTLDQVVPWGRSFAEYERMFSLTEADLRGRILGCGDGPAAFNADAARRGTRVVSCDPLYQFDAAQIRARIDATRTQVLDQTWRNRDAFVWRDISSIDDLSRIRSAAMETFLADFEPGKRASRYVAAALPALPFADRAFDLALCSHFLFLYSAHFSESFHEQAVLEMCRVANEVRIFPLLALGGGPSPYVVTVMEAATRTGLDAQIEQTPYEFLRGANRMMRIQRGRVCPTSETFQRRT